MHIEWWQICIALAFAGFFTCKLGISRSRKFFKEANTSQGFVAKFQAYIVIGFVYMAYAYFLYMSYLAATELATFIFLMCVVVGVLLLDRLYKKMEKKRQVTER